MSKIRQMFYVSRVSPGLGPDDVRTILRISQNNNRRKDITGCLLYSGEHFAQTLEGSSEALEALVPRIAADKRHFDVVTLVDHETQLRQYPSWSMGYLYSLDLRDRIESLLRGESMSETKAFELIAEMKSDSVMGSL